MTDLAGREETAPDGWPLARYRFIAQTTASLRLPEYAGSMLRGVWGLALRQIACLTKARDCRPCPLAPTCPYTLIFETRPPVSHPLQNFSAVPNAYVLEPPPWGSRLYRAGEELSFEMILFGQALEKLGLIIFAWKNALARGVGGGTATLTEVVWLDPQREARVFDAEANELLEHTPRTVPSPSPAGPDFRLSFLSPLRLQENGKALPPEQVTARRLLLALARRISLLMEFHAGGAPGYDFAELGLKAQTVGLTSRLRWRHWLRWSNRQRQEMTLNGLTGDIVLYGVPAIFHELLRIGQWTHVGKNATFGLGRYTLDSAGPPA